MKKEIIISHENESRKDTINFIDLKRNWNVEKQAYRNEDAENCNAPLTDCKLFQRGEYLILEHDNIIHYWELKNTNYPYFQMAIDFMELEQPQKWKTLDKLIALRMGIRQTEANCCGYVEDILLNKKMTHKVYNEFMALARAQDVAHHGSSTI